MCVGMKQVEVRVIIVQCLEQDFILDKHYNTVTLLLLLLLLGIPGFPPGMPYGFVRIFLFFFYFFLFIFFILPPPRFPDDNF